jgi:hypothetical protein
MFGKIGCLVGSTTPGISLQLRQYVKNVDDRSTVPMVPDFYFAHGYLQQKLFFSRSICYSTKVYIYLNSVAAAPYFAHGYLQPKLFFHDPFVTKVYIYFHVPAAPCLYTVASL